MAKKHTLNQVDEKAKTLGSICVIRVDGNGKELTLYLKKPHRDIVGLYYGMKETNPIAAAEKLLKASCLHEISDKEIFENDDYFYSAYMQVDNYLDTIKLKKSQFFNL